MYTQCPKCQTVFRITLEQLQARNGLVRCGQCDHVFNADQQLFEDIPEKRAGPPKKPRSGNNKSKPGKTKPVTVAARKPARSVKKPAAESQTDEIDAAPAPWLEPVAPRTETHHEFAPPRDTTAPGFEHLSRRRTPRRFSGLWFVGAFLLALVLAAQSAYFYRDQLASNSQWRPYLIALCAQLGCTLQPSYDVRRIELVQPTNIAPHPRYLNVLRLRATLVNRAPKPQPPPLMHVALTDSAGRLLARRTFAPSQYLEQPSAATEDMPPHLAVNALLDLANPDGKAVGYQIDFFSPHLSEPH